MSSETTRAPEEPDFRGLRAGNLPEAWIAAVPVLVLLCYLPLVFLEYGFGEDYRLLAAYDRGAGFRPLLLAEGRPGYALWVRAVFSALPDVASLRFVRLANILLLGVLATAITHAWRRAGWRSWEAAVAGVAAATLPSFQLYTATAAMGAVIVAALFGAAAAFLAADAEPGTARIGRTVRRVAASVSLFVGLATYQSAALIYFAFAGIFLVAANPPRKDFLRITGRFAAIAAPAFALEFLVFLAGRNAYLPYLLGAPRGDLAFAPLAKVEWFIWFPLPHALNLWKLHPNLLLALAMMIVVPVAIALHLRGTEGRWVRGLVALALLPLCYVPNLVVAENRSSFRTMPALAVIVLAYYLIVLRGQFGRTRQRLYRVILGTLVAVGLVSAATTPMRLVARPQVRELAAVRSALAGLSEQHRTIGVIPADFRASMAPFVMYEEFGYPSTSEPFSTRTTYVVLREFHPQLDTAAFRVFNADSTTQPLDTIIDWGRELRAAAAGGR